MAARILIADDHEIVREGIRTLIGRSGRGWEVCGEVSDGEEAIEAVRTLKPDIAILDITMPKMSGLEAAPQIAKLGVQTRVLIFTMHDSERLSLEVRQAKAQGLVLKSQAARDLIRAIDHLLAGGTFFGAASAQEAEPRNPPRTGSKTGSNQLLERPRPSPPSRRGRPVILTPIARRTKPHLSR
jgi:DNA-binding NarL/FixJ family response regulator